MQLTIDVMFDELVSEVKFSQLDRWFCSCTNVCEWEWVDDWKGEKKEEKKIEDVLEVLGVRREKP